MQFLNALIIFFCISWANLGSARETDSGIQFIRTIEHEKISRAINQIKEKLNNNEKSKIKNYDYYLGNHIRWYTGQVPLLLEKTFDHFLMHQNVYTLTDQIKKKLQSDSKYCSNINGTNFCYRMEAFYIPTLDVIFIDDNLNEEKFASLLFHELVHAYQYRYSFPIDWMTLINQKNESGESLLPNDLINLLIFRYEAQANWYQTTLFKTKQWFDLESEMEQYLTGSIKLIAGFALVVSSLGIIDTKNIQQHQLNKKIPKRFFDGTTHMRTDDHPTFTMPEITLLDTTNTWNPICNIDFSIHERFYRLLGKAYFGELPFVVDELSQEKYNDLLINYYHKLVDQDWANNSQYQNLLKNISEFGVSPFMQWLTLDNKHFENTPIFQGFLHNRSEVIDLLMKNPSGFFQFDARSAVVNTGSNQSQEQTVINGSNNKSKSLTNLILSTPSSTNNKKISKTELNKALANFILQGGEGSTPGLDFALSEIPIFIQPQLEFTKESIEQDFEPEDKPSHLESVREER